MIQFNQKDYPLNKEQLSTCIKNNYGITQFIVDVPLSDIIHCYGPENLNTLCEETIFPDFIAALSDISYTIHSKVDNDTIALLVTAVVVEI